MNSKYSFDNKLFNDTKAPNFSKENPKPDYGRVTSKYLKYRKQLPEEFFKYIETLIKQIENSGNKKKIKILDIGTGPGLIPIEIAKRFGSRVDITALDISENMINTGEKLANKAGVKVNFIKGEAENTELSSNSFDIVITIRAWHWFNRKKALEEVKRVLKPDRFFVIASYGMFEGKVMYITKGFIRKYNPTWNLIEKVKYLHKNEYIKQLKQDFSEIDLKVFYKNHKLTQEYWVGYIDTTSAVAANPSFTKEFIQRFNKEHKELLGKEFGKNQLLNIDYRCYIISSKLSKKIKSRL